MFKALREALLEQKTMDCAEIDDVIHAALVRRDQKIERARRSDMLRVQQAAKQFAEYVTR